MKQSLAVFGHWECCGAEFMADAQAINHLQIRHEFTDHQAQLVLRWLKVAG